MARFTTPNISLWTALFAASWTLALALENACFELPIVIVSPTNARLPRAPCTQKPLPAPNCMKEPVEAIVDVVDHADGTPNCFLDARTSAHLASVHYRGQSSLYFTKHQLGVSLSQPSELLGFPVDQEFVFNGPLIDSSLLRNHLAHWLFRQTTRYSPRTRHMALFIRDREDPMDFTAEYKGIYLALEKISYGPSRVALAPLDHTCAGPRELSGGWAWQINPLNYGVYSPNLVRDKYETALGPGERPVLMYPAPEVLTQSMRDYFVNPVTSPLSKLYAYLYENMTTSPDHLGQYIDTGSFVDYFLHSEMSQNTDAYRRSAYFFKDRDQPINAGPVWDFNLAYGKGANQEDWLYKPFALWKRLVCNYQFASLAQKRWSELRAQAWSDLSISAFLDESAAPIHRQLQKCANWTSSDLYCANVQVGGTYHENVHALTVTVVNRAKWMDANVARLYMALNASVCVETTTTAELPRFNCAKNGSDDGCLRDPKRYVKAVEFPVVRSPSPSKPCTGAGANGMLEIPSIDPCWLSAGESVAQSALTPFCSGFGYCEPGAGAKCQCVQGHQPPTCANLMGAAPRTGPEAKTTVELTAPPAGAPLENPSESASSNFSTWGCVIAVAFSVCGAVALYYRGSSAEDDEEDDGGRNEEGDGKVAFANARKGPVNKYGTCAELEPLAE
ncbi:Spore coat protein coth [Globisporangium polare]